MIYLYSILDAFTVNCAVVKAFKCLVLVYCLLNQNRKKSKKKNHFFFWVFFIRKCNFRIFLFLAKNLWRHSDVKPERIQELSKIADITTLLTSCYTTYPNKLFNVYIYIYLKWAQLYFHLCFQKNL